MNYQALREWEIADLENDKMSKIAIMRNLSIAYDYQTIEAICTFMLEGRMPEAPVPEAALPSVVRTETTKINREKRARRKSNARVRLSKVSGHLYQPGMERESREV
jgi:hypothetical protein